jgi:hypothetical protein
LAGGEGGGADGAADDASEDEHEGEAALSKRAAKRQRHRELSEAEAFAETPISSGFGHAMLLKMGWSGSGSLQDGGIAEPVRAQPPAGKQGLTAADDEELPRPSGAHADGGRAGVGGTAPEVDTEEEEGAKRSTAKRARRERKEKEVTSRAWQVELQLSAQADEATVRAALMGVPNVLWVASATPAD